jgi:superfamily II DNA or RNA helicase
LHKKSIEDENAVITLKEFLRGVSTVIVDECHTVRADILRSLLTHNISNASIRWGLTGTIPKEAYEYESLFASVGPLIGGIAAHELQTQGYLSTCNVNVIQTIEFREFISFAQEIQYLSSNTQRMHHLAHLIDTISHTGNTLVLVNRINAGTLLKAEILKISGIDVPFIHGSVQVNARKEEYDDAKITNNKIILATYGVAALGINIPRLFNLVLVDPGKGFIRVIQSIGRGLRRAEDKNHVEIYDITSTLKYSKRHLTIRKRFYKDAHYPFNIKKLDWTTTT